MPLILQLIAPLSSHLFSIFLSLNLSFSIAHWCLLISCTPSNLTYNLTRLLTFLESSSTSLYSCLTSFWTSSLSLSLSLQPQTCTRAPSLPPKPELLLFSHTITLPHIPASPTPHTHTYTTHTHLHTHTLTHLLSIIPFPTSSTSNRNITPSHTPSLHNTSQHHH